MIKTVPLDIPVMFFLGLAFTGVAKRSIKADHPGVFSKYVLGATAFASWFGLTVAYFYFAYPGWMWSYWIDTSHLPLLPSFLVFEASLTVAGFAGAVVGQELIKANRGWWAMLLALYAVGTWAAIMALTHDAYVHIGTYAEYHAGQALPLDGHPMQGPMTMAGLAEGIPGLALAWWFFSAGRKQKTQPSQA